MNKIKIYFYILLYFTYYILLNVSSMQFPL